jgi:hypothetical protein
MKSCGISGRLADLRNCFRHQCAHWLWKPIRSRRTGRQERFEQAVHLTGGSRKEPYKFFPGSANDFDES